jgi:hypothetical protein
LSEESIVIVCAAPLPTASVSVPLRVSLAETASLYCDEVCARLVIVIVWLPATALDAAPVSCSTEVSELEPCFSDRTPWKSVSDWSAVERELRSMPIEVSAVSSACSDVSCVFHGVSTACRFVTSWLTVLVTSKPCPLVGEPNAIPTVPIPCLSSPRTSNFNYPP